MVKVLVHFRGRALEDRGTPLRCRNLTVALARRPGVDVTLLSRDPTTQIEPRLGLGHRPIPSLDSALPALERAVRELAPDVVYGHTHKGAFDLARLVPAARTLRVADLHGDPAWEKFEDRQRPASRRLAGLVSGKLLERRTLRQLDGFTVVSEPLRRRVERLGKPALLLLGGVDPELFNAPEPPPSDSVTVGYAGSFRSYHGVGDLLTAAERLLAAGEPFRFLLIGDVDAVDGLRRRIEQRLGGHQTLTGPVPYAQVPELLAGCDVLVVPRRRGRAAGLNYPSKLSEYLALGRAVVVTDVGEAGRAVAPGASALLVPPNHPAALAAALRRLTDPGLRRRLGRQARRQAVEQLAWDKVAGRLEGFLRSLRPAALE